MKEYNKQEAIAIITQSAERYQTELVDKKRLIICVDKHSKQYIWS